MTSRQLELAEQALIVAALRTQGNLIGQNRELCASLAREIVRGYLFAVEDEADAQLLSDLIANPVGTGADMVQNDPVLRTLQTDLLEDR